MHRAIRYLVTMDEVIPHYIDKAYLREEAKIIGLDFSKYQFIVPILEKYILK